MQGTRYIDFLVPGLITMGVMMSCMWGISYGLIEKRSKKLLRRLVATPMKKSHFLFAQITVRILIILLIIYLLIFAITFRLTTRRYFGLVLFLAGNFIFRNCLPFLASNKRWERTDKCHSLSDDGTPAYSSDHNF
jgi:ABC-type multidrug transport system permease subunit